MGETERRRGAFNPIRMAGRPQEIALAISATSCGPEGQGYPIRDWRGSLSIDNPPIRCIGAARATILGVVLMFLQRRVDRCLRALSPVLQSIQRHAYFAR